MAGYANPDPIFQPAMRLISSITNGYPAEVTTTFAHQYVSGLVVRLYIPFADGMQQANLKTGSITVTGDTTFTIDLDTRTFDTFSIPVGLSPHVDTNAQVVPIGEDNDTLDGATVNVL